MSTGDAIFKERVVEIDKTNLIGPEIVENYDPTGVEVFDHLDADAMLDALLDLAVRVVELEEAIKKVENRR